jgi:uncharacterized protein
MKLIFADTFYWVASINPADQWHQRVLAVTATLNQTSIITTEEVLVEVLNFFAEAGTHPRQNALKLVNGLMSNPNIQLVHQTHESFLAGLSLYSNRQDKGYSLTDCISMHTMQRLKIIEVLTHDRHFAQEGFTLLLSDHP